MAIFRAPNIATDSLVFCVDPANHKSNPGSSTAYDIAGGRDTSTNDYVTLSSQGSAGSTLSDNVGPRWVLNGTNQAWRTNQNPTGFRPDATHVEDTGYTVNVWLLPDTASQSQGIFCNDGAGSSTYYGISTFINSNGRLGMRTGDGGGSLDSNQNSRITSSAITQSQWIFVSFVFFSIPGKWRILIDGSDADVQTPTGTATSIGYSSSEFGAIGVANQNYFDGGIGGLWVYNRLLSDIEINEIYDKTKSKYNNPV